MSTVSTGRVHEVGQNAQARSATLGAQRIVRALLDALLTRRATRAWWLISGGLMLVALVLRGAAWVALPTVATADTNEYCAIAHSIEAGQTPDLRWRNLGYPLFMAACKTLPLSLNKALPLVQHALELVATAIVMVWMRRNWGVLAGLMTGALLLVNSSHAIWSHYAQPGAMLCSVVPLAVIALMGYLALPRRRYLLAAFCLWLIVFVTREEILAVSCAAPLAVFWFHRPARRACGVWAVAVLSIVAIGVITRLSMNLRSAGVLCYSTHGVAPFTGRVLHHDPLVAPPRPARLERLYSAAAGTEAAERRWRGQHLHWEGAWRVCQERFGMSFPEAIAYMAGCAVDCIRQRPGVYASVVLRDTLRLWTHPSACALEWEAFRQSDPATFHADAAGLTWATHARAEFPDSYEPSAAQRLFRRLAVLRPGEFFAIKPLIACFLVGGVSLVLGLGCKPQRFRRSWFAGLAAAVVCMSLFYAAFVDRTGRYRMSVEWAFFAIASLGLVLPLRFMLMRWNIRTRLLQRN